MSFKKNIKPEDLNPLYSKIIPSPREECWFYAVRLEEGENSYYETMVHYFPPIIDDNGKVIFSSEFWCSDYQINPSAIDNGRERWLFGPRIKSFDEIYNERNNI